MYDYSFVFFLNVLYERTFFLTCQQSGQFLLYWFLVSFCLNLNVVYFLFAIEMRVGAASGHKSGQRLRS